MRGGAEGDIEDDGALLASGEGNAKRVDADDPEAGELVGRFTAFSFTVASMDTALVELADCSIEWLGRSERQPWGGILSHFKDTDGNILTLVQYP